MTRTTRWEAVLATGKRGYGEKFARLVAEGADIEGEARLADTIAPRAARILDAGCGMGRIGAALRARGHDAYGVDLDTELLDQARATFPDFPLGEGRLDELDSDRLRTLDMPTQFDLVVCVGNVMILLAEDTEREVLSRLRDVLRDGGRMLVGFHTDGTPPKSRVYSSDEFVADAAASGLQVEARFSSYELDPFDPSGNYAVHLLRKAAVNADIQA